MGPDARRVVTLGENGGMSLSFELTQSVAIIGGSTTGTDTPSTGLPPDQRPGSREPR